MPSKFHARLCVTVKCRFHTRSPTPSQIQEAFFLKMDPTTTWDPETSGLEPFRTNLRELQARIRAFREARPNIGDLITGFNPIRGLRETLDPSLRDIHPAFRPIPATGSSERQDGVEPQIIRVRLPADELESMLTGARDPTVPEMEEWMFGNFPVTMQTDMPFILPPDPEKDMRDLVHQVLLYARGENEWRRRRAEGEEVSFEEALHSRTSTLTWDGRTGKNDPMRVGYNYREQLIKKVERLQTAKKFYAAQLVFNRGWTWQRSFETAVRREEQARRDRRREGIERRIRASRTTELTAQLERLRTGQDGIDLGQVEVLAQSHGLQGTHGVIEELGRRVDEILQEGHEDSVI